MRRRGLFAAVMCLSLVGLAGIALATDNGGHSEPTNVSASCQTTSATVSWTAVNDNHLSGYDVYRKKSSESSYVRANSQIVTMTSYVATGLSSGAAYDFAVEAIFNDGHTSSMSLAAHCATG